MGHGVFRCLTLVVLALSLASTAAACKSAPPPEAPVTTPPAFESGSAPKAEKEEETTGFKPVEPQAEPVKEAASSLAEKLNPKGGMKRVHFHFGKYALRPDALRTVG